MFIFLNNRRKFIKNGAEFNSTKIRVGDRGPEQFNQDVTQTLILFYHCYYTVNMSS